MPREAGAHQAVVRQALDLGIGPVEIAAVHLGRARARGTGTGTGRIRVRGRGRGRVRG